MTRIEFEKLRDLPGKRIQGDLVFAASDTTFPVFTFENIHIENAMGIPLRLSGKYNTLLPSQVFNFRIVGVGPICRVEVNGTMHNGSRTHKHALVNEDDPRQNLPTNVKPRPDLEGKSIRETWLIVCEQAKIEHIGKLIVP